MRGGGGPPTKLPQKLPPLVDRQEVFLNRYEQHTKHCPYCSMVSVLTHGGPMLSSFLHVALLKYATPVKGLEVLMNSYKQHCERRPRCSRVCTSAC